MTTQEELENGIGTEEAKRLKPLAVVIESIEITPVGEKNAKKVVFSCIHPESEDLIKISQMKWENPVKKKLEVTGTWYNLDSENKIKKGSSLAHLMQTSGALVLAQMKNKSVQTIQDEKGYLAFKCY